VVEEFFEVIVGKTAGISNEIHKKADDLTEYLLDELEKYAVDNNLPIPQWIIDKQQKQDEKALAAMCPSGCGTELVKHKFVNVFDEKGAVSLKDVEEDLYCSKCGIRWIAEQHNPLNIKEAEKTEPNTPIEFESVTVKVPKPIMDFLRKTDIDNEGPEAWIEWQIVESVRAYLECEHTEEWVTVFKLGPVFRKVLGDLIKATLRAHLFLKFNN